MGVALAVVALAVVALAVALAVALGVVLGVVLALAAVALGAFGDLGAWSFSASSGSIAFNFLSRLCSVLVSGLVFAIF